MITAIPLRLSILVVFLRLLFYHLFFFFTSVIFFPLLPRSSHAEVFIPPLSFTATHPHSFSPHHTTPNQCVVCLISDLIWAEKAMSFSVLPKYSSFILLLAFIFHMNPIFIRNPGRNFSLLSVFILIHSLMCYMQYMHIHTHK